MTAIADLVDYEREHELKLIIQTTGREIGVTFWLMHIDCKAVDGLRERRRAVNILGPDQVSERNERIEDLAACVSRWDWGDNEFEKGKGAPELNLDNAYDVLSRSKWIASQVLAAVYKLENFTNA